MKESLKALISQAVMESKYEVANEITTLVNSCLGLDFAPVGAVQWVNIDEVIANDYNPNKVAENELKLLYISIKSDGYTQPVVTIWDEEKRKYVVIDGFHRSLIMRSNKEIRSMYNSMLPIVVLNKTVTERMASTVRHNRARGKHSVQGMGFLVGEMTAAGASDEQICNDMGLEPDELVRLKHKSGVAAIFKDREYNKSWKSTKQIEVEHAEEN